MPQRGGKGWLGCFGRRVPRSTRGNPSATHRDEPQAPFPQAPPPPAPQPRLRTAHASPAAPQGGAGQRQGPTATTAAALTWPGAAPPGTAQHSPAQPGRAQRSAAQPMNQQQPRPPPRPMGGAGGSGGAWRCCWYCCCCWYWWWWCCCWGGSGAVWAAAGSGLGGR